MVHGTTRRIRIRGLCAPASLKAMLSPTGDRSPRIRPLRPGRIEVAVDDVYLEASIRGLCAPASLKGDGETHTADGRAQVSGAFAPRPH